MSKHSSPNYTFSKNSKSGSSGGDSISNQSKHGVFRPNINNGSIQAGVAGGGTAGNAFGGTTGTLTGTTTGTTAGTTTNSACSGLKNTNFIFSTLRSFSKHFEYGTCAVQTTTVRPITLDFLGSDDEEIDEGILVKSSKSPCTNSIKLWKNSSFMSKTTSSPPRRRGSPNTSDDRDVKIIENGIKILLPPPPNTNNTLQVAGQKKSNSQSFRPAKRFHDKLQLPRWNEHCTSFAQSH